MIDDFAQLERELDELTRRITAAARRGLEAEAQAMERDAKNTSAYLGMSGATRASTIAFVVDEGDDGSARLAAAYATAAEHLAGFVGHAGNAHLEPSGAVGPGEIAVVLTVPTDYIDNLEIEHGGEKAFIGPTMDKFRSRLARRAARSIREELS
jgi:hypothetical protein